MNGKTKFGLSISLMAAILFALGFVSYWCLFAAAIFILITEKEEWLRKMAHIGIFSTIILILIHAGFDILGYLIILSSRMVGRYHTLPSEIEVIVDMGEAIFYVVMIGLCFVHNYSNTVAMNGTDMRYGAQGNSMQNTSVPPTPKGNPMQNTAMPPRTQGSPMQNTAMPSTPQGSPMQNTSVPLTPQGSPMQNTAMPPRAQGNPMQNTAMSPRTQGNPTQNTSVPPILQGNPVQNTAMPPTPQGNSMQSSSGSVQLMKQQPESVQQSDSIQEQSMEPIAEQGQRKKCPVCNTIVKEDATFCENCGSQI